MKKTSVKIKYSLIVIISGVCLFYFAYFGITQLKDQIQSELKSKLTQEISKNLREQITQEVRQEVYAQFAKREEPSFPESIPALSLTEPSQDKLADHYWGLTKTFKDQPSENYRQAVRRIVQEILSQERKTISDEELSEYVASGEIDPDVRIHDGLRKIPTREFEVASAKEDRKQHTAKLNSKEEQVTAGSEKVQSIERTLVQKGGLLLPKGRLQVEPSITWAHFSSNRIHIQGFSILPVLIIGQVSTETVKRDIIIQTLAMKYGLLRNLQTEFKVPYRYEFDRITDTFNNESTRHADGVGDVDFTISRQIAFERGMIPDTIASLTVKSITGLSPYNRDIGLGTGHWAVRGALIAAKSSDPAVVFGSVNYTWNLKRDIDNFGKMDPGDSIGYSLGTAIALSYQTAINFSFDHNVTFKMKQNNRTVNGSFLNVANFKTGFNWSYSERASIDFGVSIGLTKDSPDVTVELRFPYTF